MQAHILGRRSGYLSSEYDHQRLGYQLELFQPITVVCLEAMKIINALQPLEIAVKQR